MIPELYKLRAEWLHAAEQREKLATECRQLGSIDDAIPLENAANAYRRCVDELANVMYSHAVGQLATRP